MCGLIRFYTVNLTRNDGRMKVRLKVLPNRPRGGAWPPSVRAVRCPVKSGKNVRYVKTKRKKGNKKKTIKS